uniref:Uncharacterized protein n=1 Tax=Oryza glumipatula TaxID=40148 RepID=A0A0E0BSF3_9ORYZ
MLGAHQVVSERGSSRFCIMVKSGGSESSGGSHHGFDEEEVTMPVFDANLPAESIGCHCHVRNMLDRVDVHHLNIMSMMRRMRV